jgi:hypothetical protein
MTDLNRELSDADFQRLVAALPWYVNATLNPEERVWVESCLASSAQAQQELLWYQNLESEVKHSQNAAQGDLGLSKVMQTINAHSTGWVRLIQWLSAPLAGGTPRFGPIMLGLAGLLIMQSVMITTSIHTKQSPADSRSNAKGLADGPLIRVNFKPEASERAIRLLLLDTQSIIVAGPSTLGDYYLKVAAPRTESVSTVLKSSAIVQSVSIVAQLPDNLVER